MAGKKTVIAIGTACFTIGLALGTIGIVYDLLNLVIKKPPKWCF